MTAKIVNFPNARVRVENQDELDTYKHMVRASLAGSLIQFSATAHNCRDIGVDPEDIELIDAMFEKYEQRWDIS